MTHETGATWLYHGQAVRLEWQSWHERSIILPTCGLIISVVRDPVVEVLDTPGVGTNCIPIKTKTRKMGVSFASLGMILFLIHGRYNGRNYWLVIDRSFWSQLFVS